MQKYSRKKANIKSRKIMLLKKLDENLIMYQMLTLLFVFRNNWTPHHLGVNIYFFKQFLQSKYRFCAELLIMHSDHKETDKLNERKH